MARRMCSEAEKLRCRALTVSETDRTTYRACRMPRECRMTSVRRLQASAMQRENRTLSSTIVLGNDAPRNPIETSGGFLETFGWCRGLPVAQLQNDLAAHVPADFFEPLTQTVQLNPIRVWHRWQRQRRVVDP
jgi:hypothetical protein